MKNYKSQHVRSKWKVHSILSQNPKIKKHLPETRWLTLKNLQELLNTYSFLYTKPNIGTHGKGIMRIEKAGDQGYILYDGKKKTRVKSINRLYRIIRSRIGSIKYIVQEGIELGKSQGRPFDLRMMFQRKPGGPWTCTGIFSKLGKPGLIVTNYHQGGKLDTLENTLAGFGMNEETIEGTREKLANLGAEIARTLHRRYPGMHEMGIDVTLDPQHHIWIIEVNSRRPQFYPLKWFEDKTMYRMMMKFAKSYGRPNGY
ncbi:MAG: YheC/YheD family protein [Bacillaceae bacterium]|nr:YheC/YheD family protein [Bacillaceae bacterium]